MSRNGYAKMIWDHVMVNYDFTPEQLECGIEKLEELGLTGRYLDATEEK